LNVALIMGTEPQHIPDGMFGPDDDGWISEIEATYAAIEMDPPAIGRTVESPARYLSWCRLYALSTDDGRLLWKRRGGPDDRSVLGNGRIISKWPARGGPVVVDQVVYFAAGIWPSEGIYLHALDAADGDPVKAAESLQNSLDYYTLKKVSVEKTILQMEALSLQDRVDEIKDLAEYGHEVTLWCADYTLDLSGNVGIIEVPGEQTARIVQPGYESNAVYSGERDGQILPAIVSTPAAVFWNLAMMPGWQKWMPTYRYGAITWIDGDTCNVTLEEATSSQQGIDVNQSLELTDVPIDYMSCNGAVFSEGDLVLVKFTNQDFEQPRVIGFKSNPKPCESVYVLFEAYYDEGFLYPSRYVVWDAVNEEMADLSEWGGPAGADDYPCAAADLVDWLAATSAPSKSWIYNYTTESNSWVMFFCPFIGHLPTEFGLFKIGNPEEKPVLPSTATTISSSTTPTIIISIDVSTTIKSETSTNNLQITTTTSS
ncbi:hypothetical protein LCGC14_2541080, partial [marine sediment metagenome]